MSSISFEKMLPSPPKRWDVWAPRSVVHALGGRHSLSPGRHDPPLLSHAEQQEQECSLLTADPRTRQVVRSPSHAPLQFEPECEPFLRWCQRASCPAAVNMRQLITQLQAQQVIADKLPCRQSSALLVGQLPGPYHQLERYLLRIGVSISGCRRKDMLDHNQQFARDRHDRFRLPNPPC
jgi:hypothetical protein